MSDPVYSKKWLFIENLFRKKEISEESVNVPNRPQRPTYFSALKETARWPMVLFGLNAIIMAFSTWICDRIPSMQTGHPSSSVAFAAFYLLVLVAQMALSILYILIRAGIIFSRRNQPNPKSLD